MTIEITIYIGCWEKKLKSGSYLIKKTKTNMRDSRHVLAMIVPNLSNFDELKKVGTYRTQKLWTGLWSKMGRMADILKSTANFFIKLNLVQLLLRNP